MESIRQQQIGSIIQNHLSDIFIREGRDIYGRAFVTITKVKLTPDLLIARIYLSIFNNPDKEAVLGLIEEQMHPIKNQLVRRIKNKMRRMPELEFYIDDTLDEVFKMDALLKDIKTDTKGDQEEE